MAGVAFSCIVARRRGWKLHESFYRKLRLSPDWVEDALHRAGFVRVERESAGGAMTVVATR
jgi:hypothetical protein